MALLLPPESLILGEADLFHSEELPGLIVEPKIHLLEGGLWLNGYC